MPIDAIVWGIFGLLLGSFTNVLILRQGTDEGINGRSHCPSCNRTLEWYELVPVISYVLLLGKCRTCNARISLQYPLVELLMGALFVGIGLAPITLVAKIVAAAIAVLLVAIAAYDLKTTYMPDRWVFPFIALAFVFGTLTTPLTDSFESALFVLSGFAVAAPLFFLWFFSQGAWMGFGDVKFALGMGWLVGFVQGYVALGLAFCTGALVGVLILLPFEKIVQSLHRIGITRLGSENKGFTMKSEVPFGPFLILGLCIVWFSEMYGLPLLPYLADFLSLN